MQNIDVFLQRISDFQSILSPTEIEKAHTIAELIKRQHILIPDKLHVGVLGTFKAGKSTLVNALLGKNIAAMDDMELTACTSIFYPSEQDSVCIEFESGERQRMPYQAWRQKADTVRQEPSWWFDVLLCEVPIQSLFPYVLMDTPGLGVITKGREKKAKSALAMCDVVLWVLSAETLGDSEEGALLRDIQRTGIPILLVINQFDVVDLCDREDVLDFVEDMFPWSKGKMFPVSALEELNGSTRTSGIQPLRIYLENLQKDPFGLRTKAQDAQRKLILEEWRRLKASILQRIQSDIAAMNHKIHVVKNKGNFIFEQIKLELNDTIFCDFLSETERALIQRGNHDPSEIQSVLRESIRSQENQRKISSFLQTLPQKMGEKWGAIYEELAEELDMSLSLIEQQFAQKLKDFPVAIQEYRILEQQKTLEQGAAITAAAVTGAGAVAWLGPGAAAISFGTALSVIALPVILAGGGLLFAKSHFQKQNEHKLKDQMIHLAVHNVRERVWEDYIVKDIFPRLEDLHQRVQAMILTTLVDEEMQRKAQLYELLKSTSTQANLILRGE